MAKIHPQPLFSSAFHSSSMTSKTEAFSVWMKSLVFNGNGCTVFDSSGQIVYRIDNYDRKSGDEVYLTDLSGRVLLSLERKRFKLFGSFWEGYRWSTGLEAEKEREKPWFTVRKSGRIMKADSSLCGKVAIGFNRDQEVSYWIEELKGGYRIVNQIRGLVAEVNQKHSKSGVSLGANVLTLVVEPNINHSLIIGLVVVNGLMKNSM